MSVQYKYRGRVITYEDIAFIRQLVAENPSASRRRLSEKLCEAWQWKQANGALRGMVCRGLLLMLYRAGEIELPFCGHRLSAPHTWPNSGNPSYGLSKSEIACRRRFGVLRCLEFWPDLFPAK